MPPESAKNAIVDQFKSALAMLRQAIELCPEPLWLAGSPNRFWHIAYHALFYTHFYLAPSETEFVAWEKHRLEYNFFGAVPWRPGELPKIDEPYTRVETIEYVDFCREEVEIRVRCVDLEAPSGFYWLPFNKFELQLYNLRHLAHHTGQLAERLRTQAGLGLPWSL